MKEKALYTQSQLEDIARKSANHAVEQVLSVLHLDNETHPEMIACNGDDPMASNYKERYYYTNQNGNVLSVVMYGKNKKQTDSKFKSFLEKEALMISDAPTLADFVNEKYRKSFMRKLAPTTKANYNAYLDRYILPVLGDKHMDQITVEDIQKFYDWMANAKEHGFRQNLVADTITRVSGLLGRLYKIAIDMKLVSDNPIKKTLLSNEGEESGHHTALIPMDVKRVKNSIPEMENEQQRLYMGLLVYTGMRREEILGLGWEDLNLNEAYGHIQRTVTFPDNKRAIVRYKTKTKCSTRDFIIPDQLMALLKPCAKEKGFIIHGRNTDDPISPSSFYRMYKKCFNALGISEYNNHDWRTTFGTQLKELGLTSAQVADLMGHADTRMVEKVYAPTRHESVMMHKHTINSMN